MNAVSSSRTSSKRGPRTDGEAGIGDEQDRGRRRPDPEGATHEPVSADHGLPFAQAVAAAGVERHGRGEPERRAGGDDPGRHHRVGRGVAQAEQPVEVGDPALEVVGPAQLCGEAGVLLTQLRLLGRVTTDDPADVRDDPSDDALDRAEDACGTCAQ